MLSTIARRSTLVTASVLLLALSGCATPAAPGSSPSAAAPSSEAPSPEPSAMEPEAASVQISTATVAILDSEGTVLDEFTYFEDEVDAAVAALTDAFGSEPVETQVDDEVHPSYLEYTWGEFVLRDPSIGEPASAPEYPDYHAFDVAAESAQEGTIAITTKDGIAVGASADDVAKVSYRDHLDTGGTTDVHVHRLEEVVVTGDRAGDGEGGKRAHSTIVSVDPETEKATRIFAPGANFGH